MSLDPDTGRFEWIPSDEDAGQHLVTVELCDARTNDVLATGSVTLLVRPKSITLSLPAFAEQKAKAGESFELKLSDRPLPYIGSVLQVANHRRSAIRHRHRSANYNIALERAERRERAI